MSTNFSKFILKSAQGNGAVSIQGREGNLLSPSMAARWVEQASPQEPAGPADTRIESPEISSENLSQKASAPSKIPGSGWIKTIAGSALLSILLGSSLFFARVHVFPVVDRSLRPADYAMAERVIDQARLAGFNGLAPSLGGRDFDDISTDFLHSRDPQAHPEVEGGSHASFATLNLPLPLIGGVNVLPSACEVRISAKRSSLLSNPDRSLRFTALHELSHCDQLQGDWARLAPSRELLSPSSARALRLILLAESRVKHDNKGFLDAALTDEAKTIEAAEKSSWQGLANELFGESLADARALLMLSRIEPNNWRADGWEMWLQRAAGQDGAIWLLPHDHATEEAIAIVLSAKDQDLAKLTPAGLTQFASQAASDALVIKLAKQGWHERLSSDALPKALAAALDVVAQENDDSVAWRQGPLLNFGLSPDQLAKDRQWLLSEAGSLAVESLLVKMGVIQLQGQKNKLITRHVEGVSFQTAIAPSAGTYDLRYENSVDRSVQASIIASAALLQRAQREGGPQGFKTPSNGAWPDVDIISKRGYSAILKTLASPRFANDNAGMTVYFGYDKSSTEAAYVIGNSLDAVKSSTINPLTESAYAVGGSAARGAQAKPRSSSSSAAKNAPKKTSDPQAQALQNDANGSGLAEKNTETPALTDSANLPRFNSDNRMRFTQTQASQPRLQHKL